MKMRKLIALLTAVLMVTALFAGCQPAKKSDDPKFYTFNDYTTKFGTDWNTHSWETDADRVIMERLSSGLYEFKFNDDQTAAELAPFMVTGEPVDVTGKLTADQKAAYGLPEDASDSYAYQYKLRKDLKFEDGTVINAHTFVESLQLLLEPARANGRASEQMVGEVHIAGAAGYFNQGKIGYTPGTPALNAETNVYFSMDNANTWWGGSMQSILDDGYGDYFLDGNGDSYILKWDDYVKANGGYNADGYGRIADEDLAELEADWTEIANAIGDGVAGEWKEFIFVAEDFTDPKYSDFANVGLIADDDFTMTIVYGNKVTPFNAKYYQTSTWLVHPQMYKDLSSYEGDLLVTSYMTSLETSISYGPYRLESYEADKEMKFVRNENWFGYNINWMNECYQADAVRIVLLADQPTALLSFLKGEIDSTALTSTNLVDYGTSEYLLVAPNTYLYRFFYNLSPDVLKTLDADDSSNSNTVALLNKNFRLAISAAIDRNEYTKISNAAPAFALVNELYTYDYEGELADGAKYRYRDLDAAKQSILDIYGIEWGPGTEYETLDIAVDSVTGYDPELAKSLMKTAFEELSAAGNGFDPSKPVVIKMGFSPAALTPTNLACEAELNEKFAAAIEGSGFAGFKVEFTVDEDRYGAVTEGRLAVSLGAIGGARQDPWGITQGFLDPSYSIYLGANIPNDEVSITAMFNDTDENPDKTESTQTKTLYDWYVALTKDYLYNTIESKAQIMGALESYYLKQGYTTPIQSGVDTEMRSIRTEYPLDEPDPVMGFGMLQYMTFTMDDAEWAEYCAANAVNGELPYK